MTTPITTERSVRRRIFTNLCKAFEAKYVENLDIDGLSAAFSQVEAEAQRVFELDEKMRILLLESEASEQVLMDELTKVQEYRGKLYLIQAKYDRLIKQQDEEARSQSSQQSCSARTCKTLVREDGYKNKKKFRMPKMDPIKYDGSLMGWIGFWGQFRKIHEDIEYDDDDKFQILLLYTLPGSKARKIVESFPPSGENYVKAIEHLKSRCAKEEHLVEAYVRELIKLVISQVRLTDTPLSSLYDSLQTQLRALETLGVTKDKYAAILFPMVESCLPSDILQAWGRHRTYSNEETSSTTTDLEILMKFIKAEVENDERVQLARGFTLGEEPGIRKTNNVVKAKKETKRDESPTPTAATIISLDNKSSIRVCIFCDKEHNSQDCLKAQKWPLSERKDMVSKKKACFCCLRANHRAQNCRAIVRCVVCSRKHYPILCPKAEQKGGQEGENSSLANNTPNPILLQTLLVKIESRGGTAIVRVLLDSGSQRSYILSSLARELGFKEVGEEVLTHNLFGGVEAVRVNHKRYKLRISDLGGNIKIEVCLLDQNKICNTVPRMTDMAYLLELKQKGIELSDVGPNAPKIGIILGADVIGRILTGRIERAKGGLVLQETVLGWTAFGESPNFLHSDFCLANLSVSDLWELETIGIRETSENKVQPSGEVLEEFERTIRIIDEGRYEVRLPWRVTKTGRVENNFGLAKSRLVSTTNRLIKLGKYEEYERVFEEWLSEGIIEEVADMNRTDNVHYLPHHAVIKESSLTTKIRPVFDASAKDNNLISLNLCLEKGPNLVALIPPLLTKFRIGQYGVISDIRKAFLQISLVKPDRDYLRFLWWEDRDQGKLKVYRHCRVVFGVASSPFLLAATINHHLSTSIPEDMQNTVNHLKKTFYVDNCVTSLPSVEELEQFISQSKLVMTKGMFDLRGWVTNCQALCEDVTSDKTISVLGVRWDYVNDNLHCNISIDDLRIDKVTKRNLLSMVQKIFDPVGFLCPVTIIPKCLLQDTWREGYSWDQKLAVELEDRFHKWFKEIAWVTHCAIPRWVCPGKENKSIHVFCDASKTAYAAAVFIRSEEGGEVGTQLLLAKSRLAPISTVTIPRLELLATLIGARMGKMVLDNVIENSGDSSISVQFWSDSMVALTWIHKNERWNPFVRNRVKEIRELSNPSSWRHVPGELNPADLPSRGCNGKALFTSRWWEGPAWLKNNSESWPKSPTVFDSDEANNELPKSAIVCTDIGETSNDRLERIYNHFSKYSQIVRTLIWVKRFIDACRKRKNIIPSTNGETLVAIKLKDGKIRILDSKVKLKAEDEKIGVINGLQMEEFENSENFLISRVQTECLTGKHKHRVSKFNISKGKDGLLRLKTKLMTDEEDPSKFPILLPYDHRLVTRMIEEKHRILRHPGVQTLLCLLRERFWILRGRKIIRAVTQKCIPCVKQKGKSATTEPAPLPEDRVTLGKAFSVTGTDLAGPLYLKGGEKVWIVIFTCAVYRAVHFELVTSLSTDAFLMSLRRFIARRGRTTTIYSDNGTNFLGASNLLKNLDWEEIQSFSSSHQITWKFNPPTAAWWGGWWERMVRVVKELIRRNLGRAKLRYEELVTMVCEFEGVINSRPLTYVTDDPEEPQPITPLLFLQDIATNEVPDLDVIDSRTLGTKLRQLHRIRQGLRTRFKQEYLAGLVQHRNDRPREIEVGDLVLVEAEGTKRISWPLGRVTEVHPGADGVSRVASVRTAKGNIRRPFQKLYPLEISASKEADRVGQALQQQVAEPNPRPITTRYGRQVTTPSRFQS